MEPNRFNMKAESEERLFHRGHKYTISLHLINIHTTPTIFLFSSFLSVIFPKADRTQKTVRGTKHLHIPGVFFLLRNF